ncbi:MAG: SUMF1/EgtB/PvdO family nonheme iron enzyme [Planctomycetota bacterium]
MSDAKGLELDGCKILFLAANPQGTSPLALDKEIREIETKIRASEHRDSVQLISKWAVRPDDLLQALNEHRPQVVHFSGHGQAKGIVLMGADDQLKPVGKEALAYLFGTLKDNIRLVLLNACDSRPQAELIGQHIDCVIGMNKPIGDAAAIVFAASFYRALGFGRSVREAFDQGIAALMLDGIPEENTPELIFRPGVNPSEIVLVRPRLRTGRDASGNAFVTGDNKQVKIVIYQSVVEQRELEEPPASEIGPNPYMGLLAFHEGDADRFFGREKQISRLWEKLRELQQESPAQPARPRLLPILGPSGSGKSSLARAGLIPELARRPLPGWKDARVAVLTPGSHPLEALAGVLARIATGDAVPVAKTREFKNELELQSGDGKYDGLRRIADALPEIASVPLIVLIDQFEEIYSLCPEKQERTALIENLLHAASDSSGRVSVVITLRTDFLGETQQHAALNTLICSEEQHVMVPAMTEEELRAAIKRPAELAGHPLDEATINLLINDTKDRAGALPLLQFALTRIWDGLTKGIEPATTYRNIGGVGGALAGEAQRIYDALSDADKRIAKRVFLGLVQLGEGTRDTRRRAVVENLVSVNEDASDVDRVIRRFAGRDTRLLTLSTDEHGAGDTAEVTHEALFDHWDQLNDWLDKSREDIRFSRRLDEEARRWNQQDRPEGGLWRQPNLDLLRQFQQRVGNEMNPLQMDFFIASNRAHLAQIVKESKQQIVLRALLGAAVSTAVIAMAAFFYANTARNSAIEANNQAISSQVDNLRSAKPDAALSILGQLNRLGDIDVKVVPRLRAALDSDSLPRNEEARIRLGLLVLDKDEQQVEPLMRHMLEGEMDVDEFLLLRDQLADQSGHRDFDSLWEDLPNKDRIAWFRAVAALAKFDSENKKWNEIGPEVAEQLVRQDTEDVRKWIAAFKQVQSKLTPRIEEIYSSQDANRASQRANAAVALAECLSVSKLAELLVDHADSEQTFRPLAARLPRRGLRPVGRDFLVDSNEDSAQVIEQLENVLKKDPPEVLAGDNQVQFVSQREALFRCQANAAVALLVSNHADKVWPLLKTGENPTLRTHLIHRFHELGIESERLIPALADPSPSVRQAVILALGEFPPYPMSLGELTSTASIILRDFEKDPDPGIHSATEWTLNQWTRDSRLNDIAAKYRATQDRLRSAANPAIAGQGWYVNKLGQTMIVVSKPGRIEVGSPLNEVGRNDNEVLHDVQIDWQYALSAREIEVSDIQRMAKDEEFVNEFESTLDENDLRMMTESAKKGSHLPATEVSWYFAAAYCNWLSKKDGLDKDQWCYEVNELGKYGDGMTIKDWPKLRLLGYRLPLEAEWEFACRAGTTTPWSCGSTVELLPRFARFKAEPDAFEPGPVGTLKPNDWGLFDLHGNVSEWCQELEKAIDDEILTVDKRKRIVRGGAYVADGEKQWVRSAWRSPHVPESRSPFIGFRVAQALPSIPAGPR